MRYPLLFLFLFAVATTSAQTSLESFQREAEKALGRTISIVDADAMGSNFGETFCNENPVLVKIRSGFDAKLRQKVLAHELGHALICGEGILNRTDSIPPFDGALSIVPAIGAGIGSCYIDPLADAEAEKRGFSEAEVTDEFFRRSASHSKEEINAFFENFGDLGADFAALAIYCVDLRPHSFQISILEGQLSDKPAAITKLLALRRNLGKPRCFDSNSCFVLTKRLRDALALQKLVIVRNPTLGRFE